MKRIIERLSNSKVGNFWYSHGDKIKFIGQIVIILISLFVILGLILGWFDSSENGDDEDIVNRNIDYSSEFTILSEAETPMMGKHAKELSILLENPFINRGELEDISKFIVNKEIERLENSELEIDEGKKLHAMKINVYHRKVVFDEGLEPRGVVAFQHKDGWVQSFEEGIGGGLFGKEYEDHVYDVNYIYMEEQFKTIEGEEDPVSTYLTDEEYEVFKEILLYSALLGSNSIEIGIEPYIKKHYGLTKKDNSKEYFDKAKDLEELLEEAKYYGEPMNLYGDNIRYLLDYYKEFDPEMYEFINEFH